MSQENVELVRRLYAAYARGDLAGAELAPDFTASRVAPMPDVRAYHGPEGMAQMVLDWVEGFEDFGLTTEEFVDANDAQVLVRVHQRATGARSGVLIEADFWMLHTMRDGKGVRLDIYATEAQARKALEPR